MDPLRIAVVGPGRAGGAVALRARAVGHQIEAVVPGPSGSVPEGLSDAAIVADGPLPPVDLVILSVPDDSIAIVSEALVEHLPSSAKPVVVHLSGLTSVQALSSLADAGCGTGGLHPLMTLPDAGTGSEALAGAPAGISASSPDAAEMIAGFAASLGMRPFELDDGRRALYHAAASVAANMVTAVLGLSFDLFAGAGIDPAVSRPLVREAVDNCFDLGPGPALTGPVARGDVGTVALQRSAVADLDPDLASEFDSLLDLVRARAARMQRR